MSQEKTFAQIFKENRLKNKLSLRALAEKLGVTAGNLLQYEKGNIFPSVNILEKICSLFRLNLDQIYTLIQKEKMPDAAKKIFSSSVLTSTAKEIREIDDMAFFMPLPKENYSKDKNFMRVLESVEYRIRGSFLEPLTKTGARILVHFGSMLEPIRLGSYMLAELNINKSIGERYYKFTGEKLLSDNQFITDNEHLTDGTVKEQHIVIVGQVVMTKDKIVKLAHIKHKGRYILLNKEKDIANMAYILGVLF